MTLYDKRIEPLKVNYIKVVREKPGLGRQSLYRELNDRYI